MILGTKARYAVMAMVELAGREPGVPVALADLAESQEIALPYLEQIFAKLKRSGLVQSVRGPGGGYVLARQPQAISVAEIIDAAEENMKMTRCSVEEGGCMTGRSKCITHDLWDGLERHIRSYLGGMTLQSVRKNALGSAKNGCLS